MSERAPGSAASECSPTRSSKRREGSRRNETVSGPTGGGAEPRRHPYSIRTWRSRLPQRASRWTGRSSGSPTFAGGTSLGTDPDRKRLQPRRDEIALAGICQAPVARFGRRRGRLPYEGGAVRGPVAKHRPGAPPCGGRTRPAAPGFILEGIGFRRLSADCAVRSLERGTHGFIPTFFAETGGGATRLSWGVGPSGGVGIATLSHIDSQSIATIASADEGDNKKRPLSGPPNHRRVAAPSL
jgi:hypothetical protein